MASSDTKVRKVQHNSGHCGERFDSIADYNAPPYPWQLPVLLSPPLSTGTGAASPSSTQSVRSVIAEWPLTSDGAGRHLKKSLSTSLAELCRLREREE